MEKKIVLIMVTLLIMTGLLSAVSSTLVQDPFTVLSSDLNKTVIQFSLPEYKISETSISGKTYNVIQTTQGDILFKEGYPELPFFSTCIAVPAQCMPTLQSLKVLKNQTYKNLTIKPYNEEGQTLSFNKEIYENDKSYPEQPVFISDVQTFRDFNIVTINYYPFSYSPTEKKLILSEQTTLTIEHSAKSNAGFQNHPYLSKAFEPMYEALIANYEQVRTDYPVYQIPRLLIIHPNTSNTQFATALNQLVNWKKQKGFEVTVATTTQTGTSTTSIKNYLQTMYNDDATRPDYVMFIGDAESSDLVIPTYILNYNSSLPSGEGDYSYSFLEGNDNIGDVILGRLSVDNVNSFTTMVSKIFNYEKSPDTAGTDYFNKALLVGDTNQSGISTVQVMQYVESLIEEFDPAHEYIRLYQNPTASGMVDGINQGVFYFNYRGYIGMSGFYEDNLNSLTNVKKLPLCVFLTCNTGSFTGQSMIESISRLGTVAQPKGGIAAIGLSTSHTLTPYNNFMSCGIANAFFVHDIPELGSAMLYSKIQLQKTYNGDLLNHSKTLDQWMNLMGDPTLRLYRSVPKTLNVNAPIIIQPGMTHLPVIVTDNSGNYIPDAMVSFLKNSDSQPIIDYTNNSGTVYIPLENNLTGEVSLVVTKPDFKSFTTMITIGTEGILGTEAYSINDAQNGNNNQQINPGETIHLSLNLKNYTTTDKTNITVTLSDQNSFVTLTDSVATVASLSAGSTANLTDEFSFTVSPLYTANMPLVMKMTSVAGSTTYIDYLQLDVKAIDMDFVAYQIQNANQVLNIGDTAPILISLKNNGQIPTGNLNVRLKSKSLFLQVVDSLCVINSIDPGQSATNSGDQLVIHSLMGIFPGVNLKAELIFSNEDGYEEKEQITIQVGTVAVTDPTPPDEYGYICYDQGDTGYGDAPVYEWIEIANTGTQLAISDGGNNGDQTVQVSLPFSFKMYGKAYTQISVCSNGWLSPGYCEQTTFRNVAIPGNMVPKPIIAPYWNDLAVSGTNSKVLSWYDAENHYFVVQWNNMKCVRTVWNVDQTANVTFQAILYDPAYYATPLGDSPIKFQYKDFHPGFNNDDLERPNNYFTCGIMDHTGLVGVQYAYNNQYNPGAVTLAANSALLFTHPYFLNENPYLTLNAPIIHDESGNDIIEAGETIFIGLPVFNVGLTTATNVNAVMTSMNPHVTVVSNHSAYANILPSTINSNIQYFVVKIDENSNNNETATLNVVLTSNEGEWNRSLNIDIRKPLLAYRSYLINDAAGNNNGLLEAGETAKIILNFINQTELDIHNVQLNMSCANSNLTVNSGSYSIPLMMGNSIYQAVFEVHVSATATTPQSIPVQVSLTSANADPYNISINAGINQNGTLLQENFNDWLPQGWIVQYYSNNWSQSNTNLAGGTAPEVVFYGNPSFTGLTRLISASMNATELSSVMLTFKHSLVLTGASTATIGIATRSMFGNWQTVWSAPVSAVTNEVKNIPINNSDLGRTNFQICWFFEGSTENVTSWNIDDVVVQTAIGNTALVKGQVNLDTETMSKRMIRVKSGEYSTVPNAQGEYALYLLPGVYPSLQAANPYIFSNELPGFNLIANQTVENQNLTCYYVAPVNTVNSNYNNNSHQLTLNWTHSLPQGSVLNLSSFDVYKQVNNGLYEVVQTNTQTTYSDLLDPQKTYRFFVTARYGELESDSSNIIVFNSSGVGNNDNPDLQVVNQLKQNYPNPFNPSTTVAFSLAEKVPVHVAIYNIKGQLVKTLVNDVLQKGQHEIVWKGTNDQGKRVGSGIYFIRMKTPTYQSIRKSLLLK